MGVQVARSPFIRSSHGRMVIAPLLTSSRLLGRLSVRRLKTNVALYSIVRWPHLIKNFAKFVSVLWSNPFGTNGLAEDLECRSRLRRRLSAPGTPQCRGNRAFSPWRTASTALVLLRPDRVDPGERGLLGHLPGHFRSRSERLGRWIIMGAPCMIRSAWRATVAAVPVLARKSRGCGGSDRDLDRMSVSGVASPRNQNQPKIPR